MLVNLTKKRNDALLLLMSRSLKSSLSLSVSINVNAHSKSKTFLVLIPSHNLTNARMIMLSSSHKYFANITRMRWAGERPLISILVSNYQFALWFISHSFSFYIWALEDFTTNGTQRHTQYQITLWNIISPNLSIITIEIIFSLQMFILMSITDLQITWSNSLRLYLKMKGK